MPLVSLGIVVINVVVDDSFHRFEVVSNLQIVFYVIFHVSEKAFLRGVVSTVFLSCHGLPQLFAFHDLNKAMAGILSALIGMDDGFLIEGYHIIANKVVDGLKDEINLHFSLRTYDRICFVYASIIVDRYANFPLYGR